MPNNRTTYFISISQDILDDLQLNDYSETIESIKYLKFVCDPEDISIENNYFDNSDSVELSMNRVILKPKPKLKKFNLKFRESRYEFFLGLEEIAKRSQRAYVNNNTSQLITLIDYNTPEYENFVNRTNSGFTKRLGFIPVNSVINSGNIKKVSYENSGSYFGNLISTSKISISFYDVKPYY
jgi:hypothetical protein